VYNLNVINNAKEVAHYRGNLGLVSKDMLSSEKKRLQEEIDKLNKGGKIVFTTKGLSRQLRRQSLSLVNKEEA